MPASTAVLVKSRAKFGAMLTGQDYESLLSCKNIPEIVTYLRSNTHYNVTLEGIKEAAVHRGNLEALLRKKIYSDFAELCFFERSIGEHYFEYIMVKNEIDMLSVFLRYFVAGTPEKFLFTLPNFFSKHSKIDFITIVECKTYDDILQHLKNTAYYKLLLPFQPQENGRLDFTTIEAVLDRYLHVFARDLFSKNFSGEESEQLIEIMSMRAELENLRKIYRAKKYYQISGDMIRALLNNERCYLNKRQLEEMLECENEQDVLDLMKKTKYRHVMKKIPFQFIDDFADRILFDYCRRKMRFSTHAAVVMASTIELYEIEVKNLTNIIEGKRYMVDTSEIRELLILN